MKKFSQLILLGVVLLMQILSTVETATLMTTKSNEANRRLLHKLKSDVNYEARKKLKKLVHHRVRTTVPPPRCMTQPLFIPNPYLPPYPSYFIPPTPRPQPPPQQNYGNNYYNYGPTSSTTTTTTTTTTPAPIIFYPGLPPSTSNYPTNYYPPCGKDKIVYSINYFDPYRNVED